MNKQQRAYTELRERILSGAYSPGFRLVIDSLADELEVSTLPIREAIRRLEAEGLVVFRPNAGAQVAPADPGLFEKEGRVVVFTWDSSPDHVRQALDVGVTGFLSKGVGAEQLIADLQRVAAGEVVVRAERERSSAPRTWPGRRHDPRGLAWGRPRRAGDRQPRPPFPAPVGPLEE